MKTNKNTSFPTCRQLYLLLFLFCFQISGRAQVWETVIDDNGQSVLLTGNHPTVPLPDGGVVVAATYETEDSVLLARTDEEGNVLWFQPVPTPEGQTLAWDVTLTSDGGYAIGGVHYLSNGKGQYFILKFNEGGSPSWNEALEHPGHGLVKALVGADDGSLILVGGQTYTFEESPVLADSVNARIVRLDAQGNILWDQILDKGTHDELTAVIQKKDGNFIAAGMSRGFPPQTTYRVYLIEFDLAGNILWEKVFRPEPNQSPVVKSVIELSDGGLAMVGAVTVFPNLMNFQDFFICKTNAEGELSWANVHGGTQQETLVDVAEMPDGGLLAVGRTFVSTLGTNQPSGYIAKYDGQGELFCEELTGPRNELKGIAAIPEDKGFILSGMSWDHDSPVDIFLWKYPADYCEIPINTYSVKNPWKVSVFPNPMKEWASIQIENGPQEPIGLVLVNTLGQVAQYHTFSGDGALTLERNGLPSGVYFLLLKEKGEIVNTRKLVLY
ncbi:MAG: T9SS type A sorting domain-containing protein [Phaeodactylibacter sp.]|nr:T9SS type A sorting domain-containing protein [Phaeodactylibacter sp.]MCB9303063.1 T9SS type A sorting domain-containing protein [Lewinellaceae bacterium]